MRKQHIFIFDSRGGIFIIVFFVTRNQYVNNALVYYIVCIDRVKIISFTRSGAEMPYGRVNCLVRGGGGQNVLYIDIAC